MIYPSLELPDIIKTPHDKLTLIHAGRIAQGKGQADAIQACEILYKKGIDLVYHTGESGEVYNIGGCNERNNNQIAERICMLLDAPKPRTDGESYKQQITYIEDRAGHDRRYAIDATKIETDLGWKAEETFDTGIIKTIEWYFGKYL